MMSDKGFFDAEITHDTRPTFGNRQHLTLKFTIIEGTRSRPVSRKSGVVVTSERCLQHEQPESKGSTDPLPVQAAIPENLVIQPL